MLFDELVARAPTIERARHAPTGCAPTSSTASSTCPCACRPPEAGSTGWTSTTHRLRRPSGAGHGPGSTRTHPTKGGPDDFSQGYFAIEAADPAERRRCTWPTSNGARRGSAPSSTTAGRASPGRPSTAAAAAPHGGDDLRQEQARYGVANGVSRWPSAWPARRSSPTAPTSRRSGSCAHAPRRRAVVPAVQRAGRRVRPRRDQHPGRARRRRVGRQRPEGVDVGRARQPSWGILPRPHRSGRAEAPRHHVLPGRHATPGIDVRPLAPDDRRTPLQRGVPRRGAHPGGQRARRGQRRLGRAP